MAQMAILNDSVIKFDIMNWLDNQGDKVLK